MVLFCVLNLRNLVWVQTQFRSLYFSLSSIVYRSTPYKLSKAYYKISLMDVIGYVIHSACERLRMLTKYPLRSQHIPFTNGSSVSSRGTHTHRVFKQRKSSLPVGWVCVYSQKDSATLQNWGHTQGQRARSLTPHLHVQCVPYVYAFLLTHAQIIHPLTQSHTLFYCTIHFFFWNI